MKKRNIAILSATVAAGVGLNVAGETEAQAQSAEAPASTGIMQQLAKKAAATTTEEKVALIQEQVTTAKKDVTASQQAEKAAEEAADTATQKLAEATQNVEKAQEILKEATPEGIADAQQAIKEQQMANDKQAAQVTADTQAVTAAKQQESTAQDDLKKAQADQMTAQQTVTDKATAVAEAQKAIEETGVPAADKALQQAKETASEAAKTLTDSQEKVAATELADQKAQAQQSQAMTANQEATANLAQTKKQADEAGQAVKSTQEALADAQNQLTYPSGIRFTKEYVEALVAYNQADQDSPEFATIEARLREATNYNLALIPEYQPTEADDRIVANRHEDLNTALWTELSTYAASILNPLRASFGIDSKKAVIVSEGAVNFANDIAKNYEKDHWTLHEKYRQDLPAINQAAGANGLISDGFSNMYESYTLGGIYQLEPDDWGLTMNDFKDMIHTAFTDFLFNDIHWEDANVINNYPGLPYGTDEFHFALAFDDFIVTKALPDSPFIPNLHALGIHFVTIPAILISDPETFDAETIHAIPENDSTALQHQVDQLTETLTAQQATAKEALTALSLAEAQAEKAATALEAATKNATMTAKEKAEAAQKLAAAEKAVATAQDMVMKATTALATATATNQEKVTTWQQAKADLAMAQAAEKMAEKVVQEKQTALAKAQTALQMAQDQQSASQKALAEGQMTLAEKETHLSHLQHAEENLAMAEEAVKMADQNYLIALNEATTAHGIVADKQMIYQMLQGQLKEAQDMLFKEQQKQAMEQAIKTVENQPVTNPMAMNKLAKPMASQKVATLMPAPAKMTRGTLPKMGATEDQHLTLAGALLMSVLGTLGIVAIGKHDRRYRRN